MRIVIDIQEDKLSFALRVLRSLSFVKKAEVATQTSDLENQLQLAAEEVKAHKKGKNKLKTAQELLNEL